MSSGSPPAPTLLMLAGPAWREAAVAETVRLDWPEPLVVEGPMEAVRWLARGESFSHLLLETTVAGALLDDLIGLTCGEVEPGTRLIFVGIGAKGMAEMAPGGRAAAVRHPGPGWLDAACAIASPPALASRQFAADEVLSVLAHGRLLTRYQPIVSIAGRPLAMEVLIRAVHSRHGLLAPDQFVAPIEDAGHAVFLAETVALHALADWNGRRLTTLGLRIGINLPLDAILSPVAPRRLSDLRDESGLTAEQMVIELTESQPIANPEALRPALENWRRLGFRLSIDDVGPRMRDHAGLLDLPFNSLKIDRELVCDSATRASAHLHLGRIVAEAHDAGLMVIAEGIETRADWERMAECGVDAIQGYLVARPLTAGAVPLWLDDWNRERQSASTSFS